MLRNYQGIEFEHLYSNRKSIGFKIKDGKLYITTSPYCSLRELYQVIDNKKDWIEKHLANPLTNVSITLENGAIIYYLGKAYKLILVNGKANVEVLEDSIVVSGKSLNNCQKALRDFQMNVLDELLSKWAKELAAKTGDYTLEYRYYKSRWGCCNKKQRLIIMNLYCACLPIEAIRYIFVHELAHLKVANHQKAFYLQVENLWPEYKTGYRLSKTYCVD